MTSNCSPVLVGIKFAVLPSGQVGPKDRSIEPSGLAARPVVSEERAAGAAPRIRVWVSRLYSVTDQYCEAGTLGGTVSW